MDFDDYLLNDDNNIEKEKQSHEIKEEKSSNGGSNLFKIILIVILIGVLLFLIFYLLKLNKNDTGKAPTFTLNETEITLDITEEHQIDYKFDNGGNKNVILKWISSDYNILIVNKNGIMTALNSGNVVVTAKYNYKNKDYTKEINVTVNDNNSSNNNGSGNNNSGGNTTNDIKPEVNYEMSIKEDAWSSNDVTIKLDIPSGNYSAKYSINCSGDKCNEQIVNNKRITIRDEGKNIIYVTVTNNDNGLSTTKEIKVNIDKTKPTCSLKVEDNSIISSSSDKDSGIKYIGPNSSYSGTSIEKETASEGTKTYYAMDNAGNQNTCIIEVIKQVEYRSKSCITCNTCGSRTYTAWTTTNASCVPYSTAKASEYTKELTRVKCEVDSTCVMGTGYRCKWQERKVASNSKTSCEECGCSSWGEFGEWQNDAITENSSLTVETREVFAQK